MKILCILAVLGIAVGAVPLEKSKVCKAHSRPWQVRLHGGSSQDCSGVLIDQWWFITSFLCAMSQSPIASLGEHDLTTAEGTEQHISVAQVISHGPYRSPSHSLAMLRLSHPAQLNQYVQPLALPTRCPEPVSNDNNVTMGDTCTVSGWGSTVPNQNEAPVLLKCLTVPIVDRQTCESTFPSYIFWSQGMVCAGSASTDNCLNDQGAVLECDGELQGVQWLTNGCQDPSHPSVYSKMCIYTQWIKNVMDQYTPLDTTANPDDFTTP